jgi:lsr operon transcriptional repressor
VAIPLEDIKKMQNVIGIAGGLNKVEAILGALRGGYIKILITDELTALKIVEREKEEG